MSRLEASDESLGSAPKSVMAFLKSIVSPHMSKAHFFLDFAIHPPLIVFALIWGLYTNTQHSVLAALAMVPLGFAVWTLAEYLTHRFILHKVPMLSKMHQAHHDETLELIGTPTPVSLVVLFGAILWPLSMVLNHSLAWLWFAGFLCGFIGYTFVHYAVHHLSSGGYGFMKKLKWQHNVHHHGTGSYNFGVTTAFWDHIFRTYSAKMRDDG
jgi:sterol desaturase/sphingolipid hydroxylase (fatty acid hydroxylase superfamily)